MISLYCFVLSGYLRCNVVRYFPKQRSVRVFGQREKKENLIDYAITTIELTRANPKVLDALRNYFSNFDSVALEPVSISESPPRFHPPSEESLLELLREIPFSAFAKQFYEMPLLGAELKNDFRAGIQSLENLTNTDRLKAVRYVDRIHAILHKEEGKSTGRSLRKRLSEGDNASVLRMLQILKAAADADHVEEAFVRDLKQAMQPFVDLLKLPVQAEILITPLDTVDSSSTARPSFISWFPAPNDQEEMNRSWARLRYLADHDRLLLWIVAEEILGKNIIEKMARKLIAHKLETLIGESDLETQRIIELDQELDQDIGRLIHLLDQALRAARDVDDLEFGLGLLKDYVMLAKLTAENSEIDLPGLEEILDDVKDMIKSRRRSELRLAKSTKNDKPSTVRLSTPSALPQAKSELRIASLVTENDRATIRDVTSRLIEAIRGSEASRMALERAMTHDALGAVDPDTGEVFSHLYFDRGMIHAIAVYAKQIIGRPVAFAIGHKSEGDLINEVNDVVGDINGLPPIFVVDSPQEGAALLRSELRVSEVIYRTPNSAEAKLDTILKAFNRVVVESKGRLERFFEVAGLTEVLSVSRQVARHLAQMV